MLTTCSYNTIHTRREEYWLDRGIYDCVVVQASDSVAVEGREGVNTGRLKCFLTPFKLQHMQVRSLLESE